MKRFKEFWCLFVQKEDAEYPVYESELTMIDLNTIIAFNRGNEGTTTVRLISGETLRVKLTYEKFCEVMKLEPFDLMVVNKN